MTRRRDRQGSLRVKDGSWYVQWTEGSHRPSHSLGRVKDLSKSEAQKLKRAWMKKVNDRREIAGNSQSLAGFWCEHFYDEEKKEAKHELKDKRPSTVRDMRWAMRNIWIPRFGQRLLDGLGTAEIQKYLDGLDLNRKTAAKYRAYLSSVLSSAIRLGQGLTQNPARFVKLSAEGPEKPYVMPTAEQVVAILDGLQDPREKMAWQLAVWLGSRCGELRALRWESIIWEQKHDSDPGISMGRQKQFTQNQERLPEGCAHNRTNADSSRVQRKELSECSAQRLGASWQTAKADQPDPA